MKKLKVITLFSGYGTQELALNYISVKYENVANCDILNFANVAYDSLHKTTFGNLGDIKEIDEKKFPECDLLTFSFPCFTKNTLVLTDIGYKKINEINISDNVLTHMNTYEKVVNIYDQGLKEIWNVVCSAVDVIETTKNHKFLIRTKNVKNKTYSKPYWKECHELTKNDYLGVAINQNSIIPTWSGINFEWSDGRKTRNKNELSVLMDNKDFWWVIGRYIGDGWIRSNGGIIICGKENEINDITDKLKKINFTYNVVKEKTVCKIHIPKKEIELFVTQFGRYAHGKKLTNTILNLPIDLLENFIIGYHSADGNNMCRKRHRISSVSRELIYGIAQCIAKTYNIPYSIYKNSKKDKYTIENRIVNQRDVYLVTYDFSKKIHSFYENGYVWSPLRNVFNTNKLENVYDIEIDAAHSFTANGCIVHNCQDISVAGIQRGIQKGTRSGLLYEVERIVEYNKPKYLMMENVKNLVSNNHLPKFKEFISKLSSFGYGNSWLILNGADYGCPQNRERVFMMSVLGETDIKVEEKLYGVLNMKIPRVTMKTYMEKEVDEKLYLNYPFEMKDIKKNSVCKLIARRTDIKYDQMRRIYSVDGCSPCLTTSGSPQIMLENGKVRKISAREGYRFMGVKEEDIDKLLTTNLSTSQHVSLAGNSICVPVMEQIFKQFFGEYIF